MITAQPHNFFTKADQQKDCSFGNVLFTIAGVIGVAKKKGYMYGFPEWPNQEFFVNPLPKVKGDNFQPFQVPINYKGFDVGFRGFDIPDNSIINGYFGSEKYFVHCADLIRHYFTMKDITAPIKDTIIMHFRNYNNPAWWALDDSYYSEAVKKFPKKKVVVVTDNIDAAFKAIKKPYDYISCNPITDFYLLAHADYLVMANSSFSWWGAWLSKARTVAPFDWYAGEFTDCPKNDLYCSNWEIT